MIEVAAALSVANAAFNAIKAGVDRGKELHEMAGALSKFFDANETINEARIKNQETSATVKFLAGKSVEEEAMELALRKREMDMKYKALRELFIYSGNGETFKDFELIISDNASTDNTEKVCRKYTAKDKRIR